MLRGRRARRRPSTSSTVDDGGRVESIQPRDGRRACGSTAASSSSGTRSSTASGTGEELVEEPFQRLIGRGQAARLPARRLLGLHGHLQGQAAARGPVRAAAHVPWEVWKPTRAQRDDRHAASERVIARLSSLTACRPATAAADPRARAPTPTTSRSAAAGRCCGSPPSSRELEVDWVVLRCHAGARARRRARGRGVPRPASHATTWSCSDFRDGFLPYVGREVKDAFEALKREFTPGPRLHPPPRRPAPGPPPRLRADLEHLPRPPDPRVRDPEVRRRPRLRRTSSSALPAEHARAEDRARAGALPAPRRASTGSPATCFARWRGSAGWSARRRSRRRSTGGRS